MPDCTTNKEETIYWSADSPMGCDMYSVASKSSYHCLSTVWICVCHGVLWDSKVMCINLCGMIHGETLSWCVATLVCVWAHTVKVKHCVAALSICVCARCVPWYTVKLQGGMFQHFVWCVHVVWTGELKGDDVWQHFYFLYFQSVCFNMTTACCVLILICVVG
jgi:hypothetical protein